MAMVMPRTRTKGILSTFCFPFKKKTCLLFLSIVFASKLLPCLEWTMSELLRHPRVMKKLQNEVRGIVGNKTDITEDDLVGMHYLETVIKETVRLHPPAPLPLPRMSSQDVNISGYDIKANTQVIVNAWQIGRDPKSYNNPEQYEPERFLSSDRDYIGTHHELIRLELADGVAPEFSLPWLLKRLPWQI